MKKRIDALLKTINESENEDLLVIRAAYSEAVKNYNVSKSTKNVKELQSFKEQLAALVAELEEKYGLSDTAQGETTAFKTQVAVHQWLTDNGWKISLSQFNKHCKDGLLRRDKKSGQYRLEDVEKYATLHVKKAATGQKVSAFEEQLRERQLKAKAEKEEIDLDLARLELSKRQGKTVPREDHELAIVARAVAFMAHLNHTVQSEAANWIDLVEGNQQKAPQFVEAISREIEQRMGDFAIDAEFEIILEANDKANWQTY